MSLYRPPVPRAYGAVTVLAALAGAGLVVLSGALLVLLAGHDPRSSTWLDLTEVYEVIAWQQLVGGVAVVPLAVAARLGSNRARMATVVVASLLALASLRPAVLVPPLGLLGMWWVAVAVAVVLLGAAGREYCLASGRARADEREWARRQART